MKASTFRVSSACSPPVKRASWSCTCGKNTETWTRSMCPWVWRPQLQIIIVPSSLQSQARYLSLKVPWYLCDNSSNFRTELDLLKVWKACKLSWMTCQPHTSQWPQSQLLLSHHHPHPHLPTRLWSTRLLPPPHLRGLLSTPRLLLAPPYQPPSPVPLVPKLHPECIKYQYRSKTQLYPNSPANVVIMFKYLW